MKTRALVPEAIDLRPVFAVAMLCAVTLMPGPSDTYSTMSNVQSPSVMAAVAEVPLATTADSLNLMADQVMEINYALLDVASAYLALFSLEEAPQVASAATAKVSGRGESLMMTLAYMPESLYETVASATDFMAAVEMAPVYVITDALSESLFKAGLY